MEQNELNIQDIMKEIKKEIEVKGSGQPGPAYRKLKSKGVTDGIAEPTPKSSHITNIYDFFNNIPHRTRRY